MGSENFRVKKYKHPKWKFVVRSKVNGRWERKFFQKRSDAETHAQLKEIELLNQGREAIAFPADLRVFALKADEILKPYGKTVLDAAVFYEKHLKALSVSKKVSEVVKELLAAVKQDKKSHRYQGDLRVRLGKFVEAHGEELIANLTPSKIDTWLRGLPVGIVTRNSFRRRLVALFTFAEDKGYLRKNPMEKVKPVDEEDYVVRILTVQETAKLLESASSDMLPYWVIGAFAGLRSAELQRLEWSDIDFEDGEIYVKPINKTGERYVHMLPNLRSWLEPYKDRKGSVRPVNFLRKFNKDKRAAGFGTPGTETDEEKAQGITLKEWPNNALRHSFASYYLAHFNKAEKLALEMGNSVAMIFKHYRKLVKSKAAAPYWDIVPLNRGA